MLYTNSNNNVTNIYTPPSEGCCTVKSDSGSDVIKIQNIERQDSGYSDSSTKSTPEQQRIVFRQIENTPCTLTIGHDIPSPPCNSKVSSLRPSHLPLNQTSGVQTKAPPVAGQHCKPEFARLDTKDSGHASASATNTPADNYSETFVTINNDKELSSHLLDSSSSESWVFPEIQHAINQEKKSFKNAAQYDKTLKLFAARVLYNGAAGTISADALNYINQAKGATAVLSAMIGIGIVDGLYSCGKRLHNLKKQPEDTLQMLGSTTFKGIHPVMKLLPETFCQCIRKAYIYGALSGAAGTILTDFLSLLSYYATSASATAYITGYACPALLLVLTSAGAVTGAAAAYNNYKRTSRSQHVNLQTARFV